MWTDFIWLRLGTSVEHGNKPSGFIKNGKSFELRKACRFSAMTLLLGVCVLQITKNLEMLIVYVDGLTATCLLNFLSCYSNDWWANGIYEITEGWKPIKHSKLKLSYAVSFSNFPVCSWCWFFYSSFPLSPFQHTSSGAKPFAKTEYVM